MAVVQKLKNYFWRFLSAVAFYFKTKATKRAVDQQKGILTTILNTMQEQLNLFQTVKEAPSPLLRSAFVDPEMIVKNEKWTEFHDNGQLWISGEIALVKDEYKHLFDYRTGFKNYEGQPVVRIGVWSKYFGIIG